MNGIVFFVAVGLEMPEGFSARFHATFPDRAACEIWVDEIEATKAGEIEIVSECQPEGERQ